MQLLSNPTVISAIISLVLAGGVFVYLRARIAELEKLHVEQARILRSFIAHQQQVMNSHPMQPGNIAPANNGNVLPRERLVVSDDSDSSSEYTDDSSSEGSTTNEEQVVSLDINDDSNSHIKTITSEITMMPQSDEVNGGDESPTLIAHTLGSVKVIEMIPTVQPESENTDIRVEELESQSSSSESDSDSVSSEDIDIDIDDSGNAPSSSTPMSSAELQKLRVNALREFAVSKGVVTSVEQAKAYKKQDLITLITKGAHQGHTIDES